MQILIQGCINNDRESQRLLYRHYYSYGMSVAMRYSSGREEALEILNDSFLKVFQKIAMFDPDTTFEFWFRRIIINTSIDHYRKEHKHYYHKDSAELLQQDKNPGVLDNMSYHELLDLVNSLTPGYRAVFNLYVIDGHTHEEIGKLLGISAGTSKSNLAKAREILRRKIEKEEIKMAIKR